MKSPQNLYLLPPRNRFLGSEWFDEHPILKWGSSHYITSVIGSYPSVLVLLCVPSRLFVLLVTNLLTILEGLLPPLGGPLLFLLQQFVQLLSRIKHTIRPRSARRTAGIPSVPLERTALTEIMPTTSDDGRFIRALADDTCKGDILEHFLLLGLSIMIIIFTTTTCLLEETASVVSAGDDRTRNDLLALGHILPCFIELPTVGVVLAYMGEFAVLILGS